MDSLPSILAAASVVIVIMLYWRTRAMQGRGDGRGQVRRFLARPGAQLVDVRTRGEARRSAIPGAVNIPLDELAARRGELDPNLPVMLVCSTGGRALMAANLLKSHGFRQVRHLEGGLDSVD